MNATRRFSREVPQAAASVTTNQFGFQQICLFLSIPFSRIMLYACLLVNRPFLSAIQLLVIPIGYDRRANPDLLFM
jgi:hypothetical protein